jgi:Secretion system C-terminal sorting domain
MSMISFSVLGIQLSDSKFQPIFYKEILADLHISIAPNPAKDYLEIVINDAKITEISVTLTNELNQTVLRKNIELANSKYTLELGNTPNGIYFIHIQNQGETIHHEKIIIAK